MTTPAQQMLHTLQEMLDALCGDEIGYIIIVQDDHLRGTSVGTNQPLETQRAVFASLIESIDTQNAELVSVNDEPP